MSVYESRLWNVRNQVSQISDDETRRAMEGIIEFLEQMAKDFSEVKARISTRTCRTIGIL